MNKRMLWGIAWMVLAVVLVGGAVNRTSAKLGLEVVEETGSESEAAVGAWQTMQGTVLAVDGEMLVVGTADGAEVIVEGQPWTYALGQGFACQPGEAIILRGYPEADEFKAAWIATSSGAEVTLRGPDGSPMWSGRGRGRNAGG